MTFCQDRTIPAPLPHRARRIRGLLGLVASAVLALSGLVRAEDAKDAKAATPVGLSFRQDVMPVMTKFGCNSGGCHGKLAGQNGFKLSLRGYAPEADFESLTTDLLARRIDFSAPSQSLLLTKPAGLVPHEGGRKFEEGSPAYKVLLDWVRARAPGPDLKEVDPTSLEVTPGTKSLRVGETLQLSVNARYPDGRVRDVTWLTQFFSNDEAIATVTPDGLLTSARHGETAIRAHFLGQVGVFILTTPYEQPVEPALFVKRNNVVDEHVFNKLAALRVPPSGDSTDAAFARRAFLDVTGTLPTPDEARAFASDTSLDKRAKLVDSLLARPEYTDYWTLQLADLLQNRKERDHDVRGAKGVRSFSAWLRGQVAANRPWNELASDVLTSKGDSTAQPQIGYYIVTIGEKSLVEESEVADSVAQSFLGTRIGCAKCHNHPLEKYTQDDYYHFAAFFSRVSMKRAGEDKGATVLKVASRDEAQQQKQIEEAEKKLKEGESAVAGKSGDELKKAEEKVAEYKKRVEQVKSEVEKARAAPPTVRQPRTNAQMAAQPLDRTPLTFSAGQDPRAALAAWMTDPKNDQFAGAMVNRLWKHYMGVGLVEPVDDLRFSNPPSNPELWRALVAEFTSHGYDLKHVMRLILNSRAYQLESATVPANEQDRKYHSHYYARRLPAEVMLDAVAGATGVPDSFPGYPVGLRAVQVADPGVGSYFLTLFGRSDRVTACACERNGEVTLPQLLHLSNGNDVQDKIRHGEGRLAALLKNTDDAKVTEDVFLTTVARVPTDAERSAVKAALSAGDPREDVYRDLFWALLNAKEFAFNH